jgi:hypothetical protein
MLNLLHKDYPWTDGYVTQYLDLLNIRYLEMRDKEQRAKALPRIVKRMVEQGKEYREIEEEVRAMAREHNCSVEDIVLVEDYPEVRKQGRMNGNLALWGFGSVRVYNHSFEMDISNHSQIQQEFSENENALNHPNDIGSHHSDKHHAHGYTHQVRNTGFDNV